MPAWEIPSNLNSNSGHVTFNSENENYGDVTLATAYNKT